MTVTISSVKMSSSNISLKQRTTVEVIVTGTPVAVVIICNGYTIHMFNVGGQKWSRVLHPCFVGTCTAEPVVIYAFDEDGVVSDSSLSLTSDDTHPPDPVDYSKALIESDWDPASAHGIKCPRLVGVWEIKTVNKAAEDYIVVIEEERQAVHLANGYFKTVEYPLVFEVNSLDYNRGKFILKALQDLIEKYHGFLDSPHYDYFRIRNAGKNISTVRNYRYLYRASIIKNYVRLGDKP